MYVINPKKPQLSVNKLLIGVIIFVVVLSSLIIFNKDQIQNTLNIFDKDQIPNTNNHLSPLSQASKNKFYFIHKECFRNNIEEKIDQEGNTNLISIDGSFVKEGHTNQMSPEGSFIKIDVNGKLRQLYIKRQMPMSDDPFYEQHACVFLNADEKIIKLWGFDNVFYEYQTPLKPISDQICCIDITDVNLANRYITSFLKYDNEIVHQSFIYKENNKKICYSSIKKIKLYKSNPDNPSQYSSYIGKITHYNYDELVIPTPQQPSAENKINFYNSLKDGDIIDIHPSDSEQPLKVQCQIIEAGTLEEVYKDKSPMKLIYLGDPDYPVELMYEEIILPNQNKQKKFKDGIIEEYHLISPNNYVLKKVINSQDKIVSEVDLKTDKIKHTFYWTDNELFKT